MTVTSRSDEQAAPPEELVTLTIDDVEVSVPKGTLLIRAAELIGVEIPRFCDHPLLDPVGACRQCLVEIPDAGNGRAMPKPQASCTIPVAPGMVVRTQVTSPVAEKAQHGIMEFLLINHPLDCPVCDKGGECPLQNQSLSHGYGESRFVETKRTFPKPINISQQVLLDRERCVLCARCTRFSEQIAGDPFIALLERGALQQVGIYEHEPFESYFSGNTIQICPVGALTSAAYRFRSRPFDLVSTPAIAEHDACGSAIRVDHRRGKVMRRLAGDDPEVNEEWITDKDRFAFTYARQSDRLTRPLVRDPDSGELEPASWPAAFAVAARGLRAAEGKTGVLTGGRLTIEDAYSYAKFARTVLRTNDIDFRSRAHSAEESAFLASTVATKGLDVTFGDLERATTVVLAGFEPEDEAGAVFLRLRKGARKNGVRIFSIASHTTRSLTKMNGTLLRTRPGDEADALEQVASNAEVALDGGGIILVGERLSQTPGALTAALALSRKTGARLAWIPRRAGERPALDAGCLPSLLPGGRPVANAEARADLAAAWGVDSVPALTGRDADAIINAVRSGDLNSLVVGGVEIGDLNDPEAAVEALEKAEFVVSLEVRESAVTERADVVLPVAAVVEKAGTFVNWEGRHRPFEAVLDVPHALTDTRVLAGIAEEFGAGLGFRTVEQAGAELAELGAWDGAGAAQPSEEKAELPVLRDGEVVLDTWRLMIDDGRGQDGDEYYKATARKAVLRLNEATLAAAGLEAGDEAVLSTDAGAVALHTEVADLPDGVVWAPSNSDGLNVRRVLQAGAGQVVRLEASTDTDESGEDA